MASIPSDDSVDDIIVIGERSQKPTPNPQLTVGSSGGGAPNPLLDYLRSLFREETTFNIDPAFSVDQKRLVLDILKRIANYSELASSFKNLLVKNVVINIHPATRSDQIQEDQGGTQGLNSDGTVSPGARLDLYIRVSRGEPLTLSEIASTIVHELIHSLGVPAFNARLDAPNSTWDRDVTKDLLQGYDFGSTSNGSSGLASLVGGLDTSSTITGPSSGSVLVGSGQGDTFVPVGGGNLIFPKGGNNQVQMALGGDLDIFKNTGGITTVILPNGPQIGNVSVLRSPDANDLSILVFGRPELKIENITISGTSVFINISGQSYDLNSFANANSNLSDSSDAHIDYFGAFYGGYLGSVAISEPNGSKPIYRLDALSGDYSLEDWFVDSNTGVVSAQFTKPDLGGSQFTFLTIVAGDGVNSTNIYLTVRWAYSNESNPTL